LVSLASATGGTACVWARPVTTGRTTAAVCVSAVGGITRSTCPTSIWFGLSIWFQRTMSRQFCPLSRPMRIRVSPGLTA
jgi:hypothetical protein